MNFIDGLNAIRLKRREFIIPQ